MNTFEDYHSSKMNSYILFACVLPLFVLGLPLEQHNSRIVGGHDVDIKNYPYHAQVFLKTSSSQSYVCSGAVISDKHVLTLAACVSYPDVGHPGYVVHLNASTQDESVGSFISVTNVTKHPFYSLRFDYDYDLAVLELSEPLQFGTGIQKIDLPQAGQYPSVNSVISVTGFSDSKDAHLQALQMFVQDPKECTQNLLGSLVLTDRQICTNSLLGDDNQGPCNEDYGAPVAFEGILHGLFTSGKCGEEQSSTVYTSLAAHVEFIQEVIGSS